MVPVGPDGSVWAIAEYTFEDGVLTIEDLTDACEGPGSYAVEMDGETATFTLVEDACALRSDTVDGITMTKRAREMDAAE